MPNFKPKAKKKITVCKKSIVTVDSKHQEKMDEFEHIESDILPKLQAERKELKKSLNKQLSIEERLNIQDRLTKNKKEIVILRKKRTNYLLDNSQYVFDYYEKKQKLAGGNSKATILHSFFNKAPATNKKVTGVDELNNTQCYLTNIDDSFLDINNYVQAHEVCKKCQGELIPIEHEGVMVCNKCSHQVKFLIEHEKPSYKEPPKEVCFYAYKRINHFREILAQFQAKETTQIPGGSATEHNPAD